MKPATLCALALLPVPALADIPVQSLERHEASGMYAIMIAHTEKGHILRCALYDAEGRPVAVRSSVSDQLATQVLIPYRGDDVVSVRCVWD